jgi:thiol-disulfide isomerase/thioredoxin
MFKIPAEKMIDHIIKNPVRYGTFVMIILIFILVSIYFYNNYIKPLINKDYVPNKEYKKPELSKEVSIYYFYTEWCPYCKKAQPEWDAFKSKVENTHYEQHIIFREIDCDQESKLAEKYNVEGYPTIKIIWKDDIYDYDAKPDRGHLMDFLNGTIKE